MFINTQTLPSMDCVQRSYAFYGQKEETGYLTTYCFLSLKKGWIAFYGIDK